MIHNLTLKNLCERMGVEELFERETRSRPRVICQKKEKKERKKEKKSHKFDTSFFLAFL